MAEEAKTKRPYRIKDPAAYAAIRKQSAAKAHAGRDREQYREAGRVGGPARAARYTREEMSEQVKAGKSKARKTT